jgi:hypothetical protein
MTLGCSYTIALLLFQTISQYIEEKKLVIISEWRVTIVLFVGRQARCNVGQMGISSDTRRIRTKIYNVG